MTSLDPVQEKFVLHWGEMGTRWGVNRTVAQIHAILYISPRALTADELVQSLGVSRSNVSMSLRELQSWGIIQVSRPPGERRDHYESLKDVWEMFRLVLDERKRREIEPTIRVLRECVGDVGGSGRQAYSKERLEEMLLFFETTSGWYEQVRGLPESTVRKLLKMGAGVVKLLPQRSRKRGKASAI